MQCIREKWQHLEKKKYSEIAEEFQISVASAKKYVNMTDEEVLQMGEIRKHKKRATQVDGYINMIYKMLRDGIHDDIIYFYVMAKGYTGKPHALKDYIYLISKNNFPARTPMNISTHINTWCYPDDMTVITRMELLKYLLTKNQKTKKDRKIEKNLEIIKSKYPIVKKIEEMFGEFHSILMGNDPDKLDGYIEKYGGSEIGAFCDSIKKDIAPVKNAISFDVSSGFVEGNNNKFKLLKRIVYGRSGLVNLSKKCFLAFRSNDPSLNLFDLL